jgi:hypothetical protein
MLQHVILISGKSVGNREILILADPALLTVRKDSLYDEGNARPVRQEGNSFFFSLGI